MVKSRDVKKLLAGWSKCRKRALFFGKAKTKKIPIYRIIEKLLEKFVRGVLFSRLVLRNQNRFELKKIELF